MYRNKSKFDTQNLCVKDSVNYINNNAELSGFNQQLECSSHRKRNSIRKNKKGEFPLIKTLLIILMTTVILVNFIIVLSETKKVYIDDQRLETELIFKKLTTNCFSEEFGRINLENFNNEVLSDCIKIEENKIFVRAYIESKKDIYLNSKEEFAKQAQFCNIKTNIFCAQMSYPIIVSENNELSQEIFTIQTILIN